MNIPDTQEISCKYCGKPLLIPKKYDYEIMNITCPLCNKFFAYAMIDGVYKPMPKFAWKNNVPPISESMFNAIVKTIPNGGTLLELGSGTTTKLFAEKFNTISVEHNKQYLGTYNKIENYIYAPLAGENEWYDLTQDKLPKKYDCLLIDGPDSDTRLKFFMRNKAMFNKNIPWFVDDIDYEPFKNDLAILILSETVRGRNYKETKDPLRSWGVFI